MYVAAAVVTAVLIAAGLPVGMWLIVVVLGLVAAWHLAAGWHLEVREWKALEIANIHEVGARVGGKMDLLIDLAPLVDVGAAIGERRHDLRVGQGDERPAP